ncbi:MAG: ABC transporter permease subunit [Dehalococcoidia bacterium]|nr:ABC transporter permease subunit [Dehalococcoidia bacterium]
MTLFGDDIKGDIYDACLSFKFELRKHLRRRRLLIVAALAVLVPLIFYVDPADSADEFAFTSLRFVSFLIIISGAMFAGDALSGEFERKTGLLLFPTPQRRISIVVGKYVAALMAVFLAVSLYCLITTLQMAHLYGVGEIPTELAKSYLTALIYSASVVSVIYFFSSILKRTITSTLLGFFFLLMILPIIAGVVISLDAEPWFIVTYSAELITDVFGEVSSGGFGPGGHFASADFAPDFGVGIGVMMAYAVGFFLISAVIADRKSME